ncbi:MAG: transcriptional regulator [Nostoc sp.]|uniref:helix-turn-helix domain-containing protein n=1 Tax=unclassified Nostoc TaxID=2593658 RepID=UPI0025E0C728|nr:transcriptional regulator [Nostoc sp. NMS9]MBN3939662.1 transcriptional regulator [Nostoc sp. NMS9]
MDIYTTKVIETEEECDRALAVAERLTFCKNRTLEEQALHKLIVTLIEAYEAQNYSMEVSDTRQADLVGIIGPSGVVSEVVNGKRSISKAQAKVLGGSFQVKPSLFI